MPQRSLNGMAYSIHIHHGLENVNPSDDNVDVEVTFEDGSRYSATVFTPDNVRSLFEKFARSGEFGGGRYFYCPDMVIVRELTEEAVAATVADLLATGFFESAFLKRGEAGDPSRPYL